MSRADAFDPIVRAHQGAVRTFLRRLVRNSALADELAQEAFIKAFRSSEPLHRIDNPRSWLLRIAYRTFLDHYRREMRRRGLSDLSIDATQSVPAPTGLHLDVERAMEALTPERRACALLCFAKGYSHADAARITGLPLGTVKSHVARARTALSVALASYREIIG
ncbi:MAG: RNA polymerase sigma factor [Microcoleaceae cyanobacterium]